MNKFLRNKHLQSLGASLPSVISNSNGDVILLSSAFNMTLKPSVTLLVLYFIRMTTTVDNLPEQCSLCGRLPLETLSLETLAC